MARHTGRHGKVLLASTPSGTPAAVKSVESWRLSYRRNKIDVTAMGDTNSKKLADITDITGSLVIYWDDEDDVPFATALNEDGGFVYLYADYANAPTKYACGPIVADGDIDVGARSAVRSTINFESGEGDWYINL